VGAWRKVADVHRSTRCLRASPGSRQRRSGPSRISSAASFFVARSVSPTGTLGAGARADTAERRLGESNSPSLRAFCVGPQARSAPMEGLRVPDQVRRCRNHPSAQIAGPVRCPQRRPEIGHNWCRRSRTDGVAGTDAVRSSTTSVGNLTRSRSLSALSAHPRCGLSPVPQPLFCASRRRAQIIRS